MTARHKLITPCVLKPNNNDVVPDMKKAITASGWQKFKIVCNKIIRNISHLLDMACFKF